jgi:uncharacterized membrane protein
MNSRTYARLAGLVFLAVAVLHAVRAAQSLPVVVGSTSVPVWLSWVAVLVSGVLSVLGFRARD